MGFWENLPKKEEIIIAHRGARAMRPENTMLAFKEAVGRSDCIEFDVQMSRDGIPIVIHDDTLLRTSNAEELEGFASPYRVEAYEYAELLRLDFGSWFLRDDPFGTIQNGAISKSDFSDLETFQIPSMKEALDFIKTAGFFANVEIKDLSGSPTEKYAIETILKTIQDSGVEEQIFISSFNHDYLKAIHSINPKISLAALQENEHQENIVTYLKSLNVQSYNIDLGIADREVIELLNSEGFFVNVFTVNDRTKIEELFAWGVKAVFTDFV